MSETLPPHDPQAEQRLLGAVLLNNDLLHELSAQLSPECFHDPLHREIYETILSVDASQRPLPPDARRVDAVSLKPYFQSKTLPNKQNAASYVAQLEGAAAPYVRAQSIAQILRDYKTRRSLIALADNIRAQAAQPSPEAPPQAQIENAEAAVYQLAETTQGALSAPRPFSHAADVALNVAKKAQENRGKPSGITTGFSGFDRITGGLQNDDLVVIAGRPGMGKTAFALNIAFNVARQFQKHNHDKSVAFFSLEMSSEQLASRVMSSIAGVPLKDIRNGNLGTSQLNELVDAHRDVSQLSIHLDDTPALPIPTLASRARRLKREHNAALLVVDYLQLLQPPPYAQGENRVREVTAISQQLKALAKELHIPVIALSQLSRASEQRDREPIPRLSDLRDSGSIEQDADIVMFIFRMEAYLNSTKPPLEEDEKLEKWRKKADSAHGKADLIVAKHRQGETASIPLTFLHDRITFRDVQYADVPTPTTPNADANPHAEDSPF